ncbi:AraC family transcriptional regulator [Paenibacillus sp. MMS20-IR301]|uniref:AraC family transcriptional regulator n=1 Tax=Paenibacillus sp. MMS20-IR301 TaxID=2895946 RepID=UPI0028E78393|nr:AraC family transcriptional regulator [Paenibacillus sp. MMS20-IR301]WNS44643.1 AraC family transcriptional regulator [Paenibacillus sp. MMS20-IR301]
MEIFNYKKSAEILSLSATMADFTYKKHCHEEYALGVTLRGIQQYHLGGSLHSSHRNGVMLFNPQQYHDGSSYDRAGIDYVMLYIKPEMFTEVLGGHELRFTTPIVYDSRLARCILSLNRAVQNGADDALCTELLLQLAAEAARTDIAADPRTDNTFIRRAKEMMYCSLDQVLKLDDLAQEFSLSKYQFIREFKAHTGISPYQFFLNCKVEHARQSIEKTRDIYAAVADCGFTDLTHLNRHFKSMFGVTPYEYIAQLR